MGIIEKIQEKSRQEYINILKLWMSRLSGAIQQKPLHYCAGAVFIGFSFAVFCKLLFPLVLLAICIALVIYFIAPVNKIT